MVVVFSQNTETEMILVLKVMENIFLFFLYAKETILMRIIDKPIPLVLGVVICM